MVYNKEKCVLKQAYDVFMYLFRISIESTEDTEFTEEEHTEGGGPESGGWRASPMVSRSGVTGTPVASRHAVPSGLSRHAPRWIQAMDCSRELEAS